MEGSQEQCGGTKVQVHGSTCPVQQLAGCPVRIWGLIVPGAQNRRFSKDSSSGVELYSLGCEG